MINLGRTLCAAYDAWARQRIGLRQLSGCPFQALSRSDRAQGSRLRAERLHGLDHSPRRNAKQPGKGLAQLEDQANGAGDCKGAEG
jgi:hypothetical protein